jgi:EpsI family protein
MNNKTFFIVIVILVAVAVIGMISYLPTRFDITSKIKVSDFPMTIGEWQATDIPLSKRDYEILETTNLFVRDYKNSKGDSVYLYVIYSEDNRKVSHPPEVCLLGSGVNILDKSLIDVTDSINATKLTVEKGDTRQLVVYWFKAGKLYTDKYLKQQLKIVIDRMFGKRTAGAMIRVSTDVKNDSPDAALGLIREFCREIEPLLARYVP